MGCGMSSMLNPEDAALAPPRQISPPITRVVNPPSINSGRNINAGDDSSDSKQEADNEGGEEKEHPYHSQILFLHPSPSFKDYCINSSASAHLSFRLSNHFNDSIRQDDEDSANRDSDNDYNKPVEIKELKKNEGRRRGFRNVVDMGKSRGKRNRLNFGCYNTHPSYDDDAAAPNKVTGKAA